MKTKARGKHFDIYYDGTVTEKPNKIVKKIVSKVILDYIFEGGGISAKEVDYIAREDQETVLERIKEIGERSDVFVPKCSHGIIHTQKVDMKIFTYCAECGKFLKEVEIHL